MKEKLEKYAEIAYGALMVLVYIAFLIVMLAVIGEIPS